MDEQNTERKRLAKSTRAKKRKKIRVVSGLIAGVLFAIIGFPGCSTISLHIFYGNNLLDVLTGILTSPVFLLLIGLPAVVCLGLYAGLSWLLNWLYDVS